MIVKIIFCSLQTPITFAILLRISRFLAHYKAELFSLTLHKGSKGLSGHLNTLYVFQCFCMNSYVDTSTEQLQVWCHNGNCRERTHLSNKPKMDWFAPELQKLLMHEDSKILSPKSLAKFQVLLQVVLWWFSTFIVSTSTNTCVKNIKKYSEWSFKAQEQGAYFFRFLAIFLLPQYFSMSLVFYTAR